MIRQSRYFKTEIKSAEKSQSSSNALSITNKYLSIFKKGGIQFAIISIIFDAIIPRLSRRRRGQMVSLVGHNPSRMILT